ncbi:TetR/AcrR family transcriptional regulator [Streptomyces poonensis]|uniref:TetR family transcriptional regulator n=1 Tax=Streptomyces poonensis TaxID=68255 RepID=A0A918Q0I5_9ACTN|nr:TetR/AcrR family transcriptional regulator [Streptomyces poonensis]GGZ27203.1 TetR family transcriptional regulator [Streptomyces poonensis]GLJ93813.1 TetR family transcriptional regulator [Streptomyces poonensis]
MQAQLDRAHRPVSNTTTPATFWQRGYADASLDALGSATGLGRGSLYGTFGTKDALFRQCLDRYASVYGAQYEQALTAHPGDPVRAVQEENSTQVRGLLDLQRQRVRAALADSSADTRTLDELATFVVAVNQSLTVLSCAGASDAELRSVARLACTTVADTLARAAPEDVTQG